jgi:hypothetical protein
MQYNVMDFRPTSKQPIPFSEITEKEDLHEIAEKVAQFSRTQNIRGLQGGSHE